MNKNKLIFAIIWAVLLWLILFTVVWLNKNKDTNNSPKWPSDFTIWMIWNNNESAKNVITNFKSVHSEYSKKNIKVESFDNYDDYTLALMSAISSDKAPDIFVLNNNEKNSVFSNQIVWIDPALINPNDFRKKFKWVFSDDLILTTWDKTDKQEFLKWIPVWYESLWIFYNRRYVKDSELTSLSSLNNVVANLKDKHPDLIPIWIWNWSTVLFASDIATQFFMLEDQVTWLSNVTWSKLKQSLASYFLFWDTNWYNWFDSRFMELSKFWQNSVDLFSKWETFMVVGYPRLIYTIAKKWFSKNFLQASAFPHYFSWDWKTLVNYNYFVINKDTKNIALAKDFMLYLSSDIWEENYLKNFHYYLPALLSLESDELDKKITEDYNIILWDFFNPDYELSSFDKWIKNSYDRNIISILDNSSNYLESFSKFQRKILCKTKKIVSLKNLSESCE